MRDLCMHFGEMLMEQDYKLISGIGLNIGDSLVKGALVSLHLKKDAAFEDHLVLRPFPRNLPPSIEAQVSPGFTTAIRLLPSLTHKNDARKWAAMATPPHTRSWVTDRGSGASIS